MITAVTGIRDLAAASLVDVHLATLEAASESEEMRFGGARGSDTEALREACGHTFCRVIVPGSLDDQPTDAAQVARRCADSIEELRDARFPRVAAYYARNQALVRGADRVLAFTDGSLRGGTAWTIQYAAQRGVPVDLVQVLRAEPAGALAERIVRGAGGLTLSAHTFAGSVYDRSDWRTNLIRGLKSGDSVNLRDLDRLARELSDLVDEHEELAAADVVVPMPRRRPTLLSDLGPLAARLADLTSKQIRHDWLRRVEDPRGGKIIHRRLRFLPDEHARTLVAVPPHPARALILDNVLTIGGTMECTYRAVQRDAPATTVVGIAALYSADVEVES